MAIASPRAGSSMTRVAFVLAGRTVGWPASWTYYRNLLRSLLAVRECGLEPVVFVAASASHPALGDLPRVELHRSPALDNLTAASARRALWRVGLLHDRVLVQLLERHRIELLSHSGHLGLAHGVPTLGWVPDLQHRRLPELFDRRTWLFREARYRVLARLASHLVVSSAAGEQDLYELAPEARGKTTVLRFVIDPVPRDEQPELSELEVRYGFSGRYLYLPNQFWAHKNHTLVVDALALLRERGRRPLVLTTGVQHDRRSPGHFEAVMRRAREAGVARSFRPLGVVPYAHVAGLLRESLALLNPSRFEGWSTTVEEAKSTGKRVLLSDIPVHREQDPPGCAYFDPQDAECLAELIWAEWTRCDPDGDGILVERAAAELPARRREFVRAYEGAVARALETGRG